jgi:hypothetical protein
MRVAVLVVTLLVGACLVACQNRNPAGTSAPAPTGETKPSPEVTSRIEKLQEEEGDALARRDALTRAREQVSVDRAALDARKQKLLETGGDLRSVDDEEKALTQREAKILADEHDLAKKVDALLVGYQEVTIGAAAGKDVAAREAQTALREKDIARRERGVADRESAMAERERELAKRERETCSVTPTIVQAPVATPGSRYSRRDVEQFLTAARRKMSDKGLLGSDLPAPAKNLEREATAAMSSGDYGRARFAADQLVVTIDSMKVDKAFIVAKINRLNGAMKSSRLSADAKKDVDDLFRDATADYGDGKFAPANAKLNRIFGMLQ